jgi:hypothetical protein
MNCSERYNDCTMLISYLYLLKSVLLDLNDGIPLNKKNISAAGHHKKAHR